MLRVGKMNTESTYKNHEGVTVLCNIKGVPNTTCVLTSSCIWVNIDSPEVNICNIYVFDNMNEDEIESFVSSYEEIDTRYYNYRIALVYSDDSRKNFILREKE